MRRRPGRGAIARVVKVSAAGFDLLRRPRRGIVLLLYHRVGARSDLEIDLPTELFRRQIELLALESRAVSLNDALVDLSHEEPPVRDPVVVTFDDGTADFIDVALPILERYEIPVTVYLATDFIERGVPFPSGGAPLSWGALRDASTTGLVSIGSHTHSHTLLDRLDPASVGDELDRSIALIEDRIGVPARDFAYPKAVAGSSFADRAVRERFRSAALGGNRANPYGVTDPFRLSRSPVQTTDGLVWFRRKLRGGMALEESLRGMLNRHRYSTATR
jgi:peptidoglycan/xylan/chitin deacetylase (PgdA/CDA1 family)